MIQITCDHNPSCRIFLNGELLIDQTLPYKNVLLSWSVGQTVREIVVKNTSKHQIVANGVKIRPGKTMSV